MQNQTSIPHSNRLHRKQFKVVLLGDSTVGKTSMIEQFVHSRFDIKEQVLPSSVSQPSESIFWAKTLQLRVKSADCSFGTAQDKKSTRA